MIRQHQRESSATTNSVGIGGRSCPASRAASCIRPTELKALPWIRRPASRKHRLAAGHLAARRVSANRSASDFFSAMFEMTATTCGKLRKMSAPVSPLEVGVDHDETFGRMGCQQRQQDRHQGLGLPDPVMPIIRPCGPMPPSASSFRSKYSGSPVAVTPMGTRSSSRRRRGAHRVGTSNWEASGMSSRVVNDAPARPPSQARVRRVQSHRAGCQQAQASSVKRSSAWSTYGCQPPVSQRLMP